MSAPPVGAYGLRVSGLESAGAWLGRVPERFPRLHVAFGTGDEPDGPPATDDRVVFELGPDRRLIVDRGDGSEASATCVDPRPPSGAEAVHPLLSAAAAVVCGWQGYQSFHAAGFVGAGGVWGLLGDKESGKSTLAAALAAGRHAVVCDDMLVLRGRTAFAGPRCVDLRTDAARRLGLGEELDTDGPRPRRRVALDPIDAELPLAGWVMLAWSERVELVRLAPRQVLRRLASRQTWPHAPMDPLALLRSRHRPNLGAAPPAELDDAAGGRRLPGRGRVGGVTLPADSHQPRPRS